MNDKKVTLHTHQSVWHPCTQMKHHEAFPPILITRGEGVWLYGADGKRYLDTISSWWVNLFGHCNPRINAAIIDQLSKLEHAMLAGLIHEPVVELSERLSAITPGNLSHCFYASDGSSANEIALKMSFHYWQQCGFPDKTQFVNLQNGYHGETLGALSVTDVPLFRQIYAPLLRPAHPVPTPDWRVAETGTTPETHALKAAAELESYLAQHHASTAALILEPLIQGAGGMGMYHPVYLQRAREICDTYRVHLIADEIAVGFGRTGTLFACEQAGITPDFMCLAKGLSGGYLPLSVVMTNDAVYRAFYRDETNQAFLHSHSHSGNILACRAALATLDIIEQDNVIETNRKKTDFLNQCLQPVREHPNVKNFRNCGMIWAFEVDNPQPDFTHRFAQKGLEQQLLIRPMGNSVYIMPPYIINEEEMELMARGILHILNRI
ncbi:adenosylmethionine--8-amino-7-oxononanoate transaminase [Nitrosomonas eutropha]|uniref:Adenosylmethionine-8-amino-7-oxononanoate aminotransferase n=2 Tax=Nitrosomonas eutropha TaxID=916 RepID=A0ABX5MAJ1_9PROT|nr:adenosylmethionine--8-amino-7-oxononanoate transaminase [Nitrosomonas eutropha]ABI58494.1 adenosylmethionine-8-amino-7-oxononanoate aminotransferase apoenzyme [Nitrosomonas eutropha C91]PXV84318.1 adenosylmethionine-8-amino-7-oxononanoate aminotransferase [Nitrosomonas eutropha]SEI51611.1 adenosylmethionine-8-amino-7-oxononanoate aminotransferase [Nitrosomonas eutropha]